MPHISLLKLHRVSRLSGFHTLMEFAIPFSMVVKGYRTPLEIEDLWDLRDSEKTQHVFCTFEKRMKAGVRKAQRKLEIWHRKRKQRLAGTDLTNGLTKAQSQDALVLVNITTLWEVLQFISEKNGNGGNGRNLAHEISHYLLYPSVGAPGDSKILIIGGLTGDKQMLDNKFCFELRKKRRKSPRKW